MTPTNIANLCNFVHNVGIADEKITLDLPGNILNYILVVIMNTDISAIKYSDRQALIIGKPQSTGLTVLHQI